MGAALCPRDGGEKVYTELVEFADEVRRNGNHEARLAIRRNLSKLASDLQWDEDMRGRIEGIKQEMLASDQAQQAPAAMWRTVSTTLIDQLNDPESFLRQKITAKVKELAHRLLEDSEFLAQANALVDKAALRGGEIRAGNYRYYPGDHQALGCGGSLPKYRAHGGQGPAIYSFERHYRRFPGRIGDIRNQPPYLWCLGKRSNEQ